MAISGVTYMRWFSPHISMSVCLALHHESSERHSYKWKDVYCRIVGARKLYPFIIDFKVLTVDIVALFCCNKKIEELNHIVSDNHSSILLLSRGNIELDEHPPCRSGNSY